MESFIQKSDIRTHLNMDGGQKLFETDFISKNESNVLPVLGYFSLVGLSRYMCLLGQYEDCLKALAPLNPFNKQFLYTLKVRSRQPSPAPLPQQTVQPLTPIPRSTFC